MNFDFEAVTQDALKGNRSSFLRTLSNAKKVHEMILCIHSVCTFNRKCSALFFKNFTEYQWRLHPCYRDDFTYYIRRWMCFCLYKNKIKMLFIDLSSPKLFGQCWWWWEMFQNEGDTFSINYPISCVPSINPIMMVAKQTFHLLWWDLLCSISSAIFNCFNRPQTRLSADR